MDNVVRSSVSCRVVSFPSICNETKITCPLFLLYVLESCIAPPQYTYRARRSIRLSLAHHQHHHTLDRMPTRCSIYIRLRYIGEGLASNLTHAASRQAVERVTDDGVSPFPEYRFWVGKNFGRAAVRCFRLDSLALQTNIQYRYLCQGRISFGGSGDGGFAIYNRLT